MTSRRMAALLSAAVVALSACGDQVSAPCAAEVPNDGIQLSGRVGGAQLSVSYGDPTFQITDCDVDDGLDRDWCLVARSIDGARVELVFENPLLLTHEGEGETEYDVDFDRCTTCDDIETGAIVDVVVDGERRRAVDGTLRVVEVGPRYAMSFILRFDDGGTLSGEFNVRPLGAPVG